MKIALLVAVAFSALWLHAAPSPATRLVTAELSVDGAVVLRASTSDDGHPDADAVWGYLSTLRFAPTEAFAELAAERRPEAEDGALVLLGRPDPERGRAPDGGPYRHPDVRLHVAYGGTADARTLRLFPTDDGAGWLLDPAEAERWFSHRSILRDWAARLEDPRRAELGSRR